MATERRRVERELVAAPERRAPRDGRGIGVDATGGPVIDPTENVRELFEAGARRQDDLRLAERRLQEEKIIRVENALHAVQREVQIRAEHQVQIDALESKRLDAVRNVDQLAAKTEADRSAAAVTALATAATTTAVTLRATVDTSAQALATQFTNTVTQLTERIASLEKSSYTGAGKQAVADPMMEALVNEMRTLTAQRAADAGKATVADPALVELTALVRSNTMRLNDSAGRSAGGQAMWGYVAAAFAFLLLLFNLYTSAAKIATVTPQVIYGPAPVPTERP
jgi:hypothetical protein